MGYRVSWIAREGTSTVELLKFAKRQPTGERHDFPDVGHYLLELPRGTEKSWVLLIADGTENFTSLQGTDAQVLSKDGSETLFFWCSDTVMATQLVCFRDGLPAWSIDYDCSRDSESPLMEGDLPAEALEVLHALQERQRTEQEVDHIYDLAAELGHRLTGFRHDSDVDTADEEPFQVLA